MTDPTTPQPQAPYVPAPVAPKKPSIGKRILIIGVSVVAAAGAWIGTQAILTAINDNGSASVPAPAPADPVTYTSSAYGFSVELPSEPEEATTNQMLGGGLSAELTTATLTSKAGNYIVSAAKFPEEISFADQEIETTLDNSVTGMVGAITGAELESSESVELDGVPARAGVISVAGQPDQLFVVAFSNNIQYVLITSDVSDAGHQAFVDSFAFGA